MRYTNPVIPGFYPDPSICRVGEDYYLVTSSFEYFPGVPIFHSRDLVHWKQIGHCLTTAQQLPLEKIGSSGGVYAPTIRYHQGRFTMITTNVNAGKHFVVTADDPAGAWSNPIWIDERGVDPSLFFDDDGTVYFTWANHPKIYQAVLDIETGKLLTEPKVIWTGTGGRYPEAPHLYKIGGKYYLLIAEGGTEYGHMITLARSDSPFGEYEPCPHNPILTHRNRGSHAIQGTGHGDLVQAHDGSWWMVFLAFRVLAEYQNYHHLGRETFLAPVQWDDDGWLHVYHDAGIEQEMVVEGSGLPVHVARIEPVRDNFDHAKLDFHWNFLRNPRPADWSLTERPGWLRLRGSAVTLNDADSPAFVGRRQQHFTCQASTRLDFAPTREGDEAGLTVLMNEQHHYEIAVTQREGRRCVIVRRRIGDLSAMVAQQPIPDSLVTLHIHAEPTRYTFLYALDGQTPHVVATGAARYLSSEVAGGFTGVYLAMYATGTVQPASTPADFDWFDYQSA